MGKGKFYTNAYLDDMRQQTDPLADNAFHALKESSASDGFRTMMGKVVYNSSAWPEDLPEATRQYFASTNSLPAFANKRQMQKGAEVFSRHADDMLSMLGFASLPYCYASADGARVLQASPRLIEDASARLLETARFVLDVMDPLAFTQQGKGFRSIQKVRLMHAAIRYYIGKQGEWNDEEWGKPVNQEDMAGTQFAFWYIPVKSLRKIGITLSQEEKEAFAHLWKVIGSLIGVEPNLLPDTTKEAYHLMKLIDKRSIKPSDHGKALTRALVNFFESSPIKGPWGQLTEPYIRYLLGDAVANAIGIKKTPFLNVAFKPMTGLRRAQSLLSPGNKFYTMRSLLGKQLRSELSLEARQKPFAVPSGLKKA